MAYGKELTYSDWKKQRKDTGGGYKGWAEDQPLGPGGESAYNPQRPEYQIDPAEMYSFRRNIAGAKDPNASPQQRQEFYDRWDKQDDYLSKREDEHTANVAGGLQTKPDQWDFSGRFLSGPGSVPKANLRDYYADMWGKNKKGEGDQEMPDWFTGGTPKPGFFTGQLPQEGLGL